MDHRHITDVPEVLMRSVRRRPRAVPVAWRVRSTPGTSGVGGQKELLHSVKAWFPEGLAILLAAERL